MLKKIDLRPTQENLQKIALVLCLKMINLGPTQEKIKIAVVRCLKRINLRPTQGEIQKKRDGPVLKNDQLKTYTGK